MPSASEIVTSVAPPRKTRFIFKVLGFMLFVFAAWVASCSYRQGELIDLTNSDQQQWLLCQADEDIHNIREAIATIAVNIVIWFQSNSAETKSAPPKLKDESPAVISEPKRPVRLRNAPPKTTKILPSSSSPDLDLARAEYHKGEEAYAKTDPMSPTEEVQKYLYIAEPLFARCQDLLEQARKRGVAGSEIDNLEQAASKRLYDCRKRMALKAR